MLTYSDLVDLGRALQGRTVLSVYVNWQEPDLAKRRRWRVELRHSLNDIETWLSGAPHADREAFASCRRALLERFDEMRGRFRDPGWAAFYTADGEQYAGPVAAAVPTMAVWSVGPCLTPYIRALKEAHPVMVVVADARKARVFRYAARKLEHLDTVRARTVVEHPDHMSAPPRPGFHSGTHGTSGADQAQRELRDGTAHMLNEVVSELARNGKKAQWFVLGGIPSVAADLLSRLPAELATHAARAEHLDVHATKAQIIEAARQTASALRDARDLRLVNDAVACSESNGFGVTGSVDTKRVLNQARAREVYFTEAFLANNAAAAEEIVRLALGSRAFVEHVSGAAAARLDEVGGVAARLRYTVEAELPTTEEPEFAQTA
ncbi:MAG: hypothetical protein AB1762_02140 [Gemmatimonadota bacterium]